MSESPVLVWLAPTLLALVSWGVGQGLVKKFIAEVPAARFCLYLVVAKSLVNLGYFVMQAPASPFDHPDALQFIGLGLTAYLLDGMGWVLYFLAIIAGPITIVGTVSAAYPAITVLLAGLFLGEVLSPAQYLGVAAVILGCVGLGYDVTGQDNKKVQCHWVIFAAAALLLWGVSQTLVKHAYSYAAASEGYMALFNIIGGTATLGVYGLIYGRTKNQGRSEWIKSLLPMGLMAIGDLFVIIALSKGPTSIVSPVSGAYPLVTLLFARFVLKESISNFHWLCILLVMAGIFLSPGST